MLKVTIAIILFCVCLLTSSGFALDADLYQCFVNAGTTYGVHPHILLSIARLESNFNPKAFNKNPNGTYDMGIMQINSSWLPTLKKYGFNTNHLWDPCQNVFIGAWILSQCIKKYGPTWGAIGCYNSQKTSSRISYSKKIYKIFFSYFNSQ